MIQEKSIKTEIIKKDKLQYNLNESIVPACFLTSLSLLGLEMPLSYLFIFLLLIYSYNSNKYDFLIQATILFGAFDFYDDNVSFPFKLMDISLIICIIAPLIYRKDSILKKILIYTVAYFIFLIYMSTLSDETFFIQFRRLREYLFIIYFMFPLILFTKTSFDLKVFAKRLLLYIFIICILYIIDCIILNAHILLPRTHGGSATFMDLSVNFFSGYFPRKYPQPLYLISICIFFIIYFYKLNKKQWTLISLALIVTRTFTFIGGLLVTYFLFSGNWKKKILYLVLFILMGIASYFVDGMTGGKLRVQQFTEQITMLYDFVEFDDLADFGSGRGAQVIPKLDLLISMGKIDTGFGFLHNELTTNPKYLIVNSYYEDVSKSEEVAAMVENTQIQSILDIGLIGFLIQHLFYFSLYFIIRNLKYSKLYLLSLICVSLLGIGGFGGLTHHFGVITIGLSLGCVLLSNKKTENEQQSYSFNHNTGL